MKTNNNTPATVTIREQFAECAVSTTIARPIDNAPALDVFESFLAIADKVGDYMQDCENERNAVQVARRNGQNAEDALRYHSAQTLADLDRLARELQYLGAYVSGVIEATEKWLDAEPQEEQTEPQTEPQEEQTEPQTEPQEEQTEPQTEPQEEQTEPQTEPQEEQTEPTRKYTAIVGTGYDKTGAPLNLTAEQARERVEGVLACCPRLGGWTLSECWGGWVDNGATVREPSIRVEIASDCGREYAERVAVLLRDAFAQNCVYFEACEPSIAFI